MNRKKLKTFAALLFIFISIGCTPNESDSSSSSSSSSKVSSSIKSSSSSSISTPDEYIDLDDTAGIVEAESYFYSENCALENTQDVGGGKNVGWIENGTVLKYNVKFTDSGYYQIMFRVAGDSTSNLGSILQLYVDNSRLLLVDIIGTGGWQIWESAYEYGMISGGFHIIELRMTNGGFNINKMEFKKVANTKAEYEESLNETSNATILQENAVEVYLTSSEQSGSGSWYNSPKNISNKLEQQAALNITELSDSSITTINVDTSTTYQAFLGMGTSLEESSINNIKQLSPSVRETFLRSLIDPVNGAGMTLFRMTIGTADFTAQEFYTYYDNAPTGEPDWENGFSIQKDIDFKIIETIQDILKYAIEYGVEDEIRIFGSSWTPPGWMKNQTSSSRSYQNNEKLLKGGSLNDNYIDDLAMYYVRYLEEYAKIGIKIYAITLQNEPLLEIDYPSCRMTATQEGKLAVEIRNKIAQSTILSNNGVNPKLWAFDHNFSEARSFVTDMFKVAGAKDAIDGIAFHDYSGSPTIMQDVLDDLLDDDQTVNLTERSVWGSEGANRIIQYFRNGAISYNSWVTMLDSNINYHQWVGTPGPTMFVRRALSTTEYWATPEFYITGNFTRFIRPGYVRVASDYGSSYTVTNVVYKDPTSNKVVAVVVNRTDYAQKFKMQFNNQEFIGVIPSRQIATYVWDIE